MVNHERAYVLLFYYFVYLKVNLDLEKTNLGESSPSFIFTAVNFDPFILERGELMVNLDPTVLL